jgi:SNF2 family DNA or RNA helicase
VDVLKSHTVSPEHREEWLDRTVQRGVDVLICNPEMVKTGLDLYQFPTIVFYQTGYSIYTLRQASRRSWRIGQTKPVKVFYLCYRGTMQEKALRLIASKLETSLVVEGELSDKGLQALSQAEGSMVLELARALVEGFPENESLSEAWARTRRKEIEADLTGAEKKATVR